MGVFGKNREAADTPRGGTTIVADGSRIQGELTLAGKLHIDGYVNGRIDCQGDVSLGRSGRFEGEIHAERLLVSGLLRGQVHCKALEIVSDGVVEGEVITDEFVIESGGRFVGQSQRREETDAQVPESSLPQVDLEEAMPELSTEDSDQLTTSG